MRRALAIGALSALGVLVACAKDPKGELVVAVTTDMAPGQDFERVRVEVLQAGVVTQRIDREQVGGPGFLQFPFTVGLVRGGSDEPVEVRVITGSPPGSVPGIGTPLTFHAVSAKVPTDRVALLRVHVDALCAGAARVDGGEVDGECDARSSCVAGRCFDRARDTAQLPTWNEGDVFGKNAALGESACFDTVNCFANGAMVDVDLATCTIAHPSLVRVGVNVGLVPHAGERFGICGNEACYVPLDADERSGFLVAGSRIALPPAACDRLAKPTVDRKRGFQGVALTTTCPTKTVALPTCGPWSSAVGAFTQLAKAPDGYDAGRDAPADAPNDGSD